MIGVRKDASSDLGTANIHSDVVVHRLLSIAPIICVDLDNKDCYDHFGMGVVRKKSQLRMWLDNLVNWLIPGLGVKRWLLLILFGTTLIGVGLGVVILDIYRNAPETWWLPILSAASLRQLSRPIRALIFGGIGFGVLAFAIWELNRVLMRPFVAPGRNVANEIRRHRQRDRGPRIVAIGGGHGLATLLRGLKAYTYNLTAVVTVADDGGSSGRIRQELGILPPGDIRNCLAALSDDEALLGQLFQYRFPEGEGLQGHSFGNLFITALSDITGSIRISSCGVRSRPGGSWSGPAILIA